MRLGKQLYFSSREWTRGWDELRRRRLRGINRYQVRLSLWGAWFKGVFRKPGALSNKEIPILVWPDNSPFSLDGRSLG